MVNAKKHFCRACGLKYPRHNDYGHSYYFCKNCRDEYGRGITIIDDPYCIECGTVLPKEMYRKTDGSGELHLVPSRKFRCRSCDEICKANRYTKSSIDYVIRKKDFKSKCLSCGAVIKKMHGYCDPCKEIRRKKNYEKNGYKNRIAQQARSYPDKVNVIYECRCETDKKINHHFDYKKPFEVIRLCYQCHKIEHRRLRLLNKYEPILLSGGESAC